MKYLLVIMLLATVACSREGTSKPYDLFGPDAANSTQPENSPLSGEYIFSNNPSSFSTGHSFVFSGNKFDHYYFQLMHQGGPTLIRHAKGDVVEFADRYELHFMYGCNFGMVAKIMKDTIPSGRLNLQIEMPVGTQAIAFRQGAAIDRIKGLQHAENVICHTKAIQNSERKPASIKKN